MSTNWQKALECEIAALESDLSQWFASYEQPVQGLAVRQFAYHIEELIGRADSKKNLRRELDRHTSGLSREIAAKKAEIYRLVNEMAHRVAAKLEGSDPVLLTEKVILPSIAAWCYMQSIETKIDNIEKKGGLSLGKVAVVAGGVTLATLIINKIIMNVKKRKQEE